MIKPQSRGIRILSLLLSVVCLFGILPPAAVTAETLPDETEMIYTSLVYAGASQSSRVIGRLEDGTEITVLNAGSDYYRIDCHDTDGYIAASQVAQTESGAYYVSCQPDSDHTVAMENHTPMEALLFRTAVLELAKTELGDPYVYGATGPNSFDCSGFTSYIYGNTDCTLARMCSGQMAQGVIISREALQAGDLVFFGGSTGSVFHVGIYAGDGQIIHASSSKGISYADLESVWFDSNYLCARRMIVADTQISQPDAVADRIVSRTI